MRSLSCQIKWVLPAKKTTLLSSSLSSRVKSRTPACYVWEFEGQEEESKHFRFPRFAQGLFMHMCASCWCGINYKKAHGTVQANSKDRDCTHTNVFHLWFITVLAQSSCFGLSLWPWSYSVLLPSGKGLTSDSSFDWRRLGSWRTKFAPSSRLWMGLHVHNRAKSGAKRAMHPSACVACLILYHGTALSDRSQTFFPQSLKKELCMSRAV